MRFSITFTQEEHDEIREAAREQGRSINDIMRDARRLYIECRKGIKEGGRVEIVLPDGSVREILLVLS